MQQVGANIILQARSRIPFAPKIKIIRADAPSEIIRSRRAIAFDGRRVYFICAAYSGAARRGVNDEIE